MNVDAENAFPLPVDNQTRRRSLRWHPKINLYRMTFILAAVGFGTAKAVLTQQGRSVAPITLEWIVGVVVALIFQLSANYDLEGRAPKIFPWIFTFDCMDIIWGARMRLSSVHRPSYTSKELERLPTTDIRQNYPSMTLYRVVVSLIVTIFGISKAILGYYGFNAEVTWIDWLLGTVLTTGLYLLGLYEFNSSNFWAPFFIRDRIKLLTSLSSTVLLVILAASFAWSIRLLGRILRETVSHGQQMLADGYPLSGATFPGKIMEPSLRTFSAMIIFVVIGLGTTGFFWALTLILRRLLNYLHYRPTHGVRVLDRLQYLKPYLLLFALGALHLLGIIYYVLLDVSLSAFLLDLLVASQRTAFQDVGGVLSWFTCSGMVVVLNITSIFFISKIAQSMIHLFN